MAPSQGVNGSSRQAEVPSATRSRNGVSSTRYQDAASSSASSSKSHLSRPPASSAVKLPSANGAIGNGANSESEEEGEIGGSPASPVRRPNHRSPSSPDQGRRLSHTLPPKPVVSPTQDHYAYQRSRSPTQSIRRDEYHDRSQHASSHRRTSEHRRRTPSPSPDRASSRRYRRSPDYERRPRSPYGHAETDDRRHSSRRRSRSSEARHRPRPSRDDWRDEWRSERYDRHNDRAWSDKDRRDEGASRRASSGRPSHHESSQGGSRYSYRSRDDEYSAHRSRSHRDRSPRAEEHLRRDRDDRHLRENKTVRDSRRSRSLSREPDRRKEDVALSVEPRQKRASLAKRLGLLEGQEELQSSREHPERRSDYRDDREPPDSADRNGFKASDARSRWFDTEAESPVASRARSDRVPFPTATEAPTHRRSAENSDQQVFAAPTEPQSKRKVEGGASRSSETSRAKSSASFSGLDRPHSLLNRANGKAELASPRLDTSPSSSSVSSPAARLSSSIPPTTNGTPQVPTGPRALTRNGSITSAAGASASTAIPTGPRALNQPCLPPRSSSTSTPATPAGPPRPQVSLPLPSPQAPQPPPVDPELPPPPPPPPVDETAAGGSRQHSSLPRAGWKVVSDSATRSASIQNGSQAASQAQAASGPRPLPLEIVVSGVDPRKKAGGTNYQAAVKESKRRSRKQLAVVKWRWDKQSTGPKPPVPPKAILIDGLSPLVTVPVLKTQLRSFGRIEEVDLKHDPQTGQSLGICWVKFCHDFREREDAEGDGPLIEGAVPPGQKGYKSAADAVKAMHGQKFASTSGSTVVSVILDGEREGFVATYRKELGRRYPPRARASQANQSAPSPATHRMQYPVPDASPASASHGLTPNAYTHPDTSRLRQPQVSVVHHHDSPMDRLSEGSSSRTPSYPQPNGRYSGLKHHYEDRSARDTHDALDWRRHETSSRDHADDSYNWLHNDSNGRTTSRRPSNRYRDDDYHAVQLKSDIYDQLSTLGHPYVFVAKPQASTDLNSTAIRHHFSTLSPQAVFSDGTGWYVAFNSADAASRSKFVLDQRPLYGYNINIEVRDAPILTRELRAQLAREESEKEDALARVEAESELKKERPQDPRLQIALRKASQGWTEAEILQEAQEAIMRELEQSFLKDLRNRVIGPFISDLLESDNAGGQALAQAMVRAEEARRQRELDLKRERESAAATADLSAPLPSFRKVRKPVKQRSPSLDSDAAHMPSSGRKDNKGAARGTGKPTRGDEESGDEDEEMLEADALVSGKGVSKTSKFRPRSLKNVEYTSSEDDDEDEGEGEAPVEEAAPLSKALTDVSEKVSGKKTKAPAKGKKAVVTKLEDSESVTPEPKAKPSKGGAKKAKAAKTATARTARSVTPDPYALGLAEDEEDLYFLQVALKRLTAGESISAAAIEEDFGPSYEEQAPEEADMSANNSFYKRANVIPVHESGSARTEGFYKIPPAQKAAHIPDRNKATADTSHTGVLASARDNRADSRRVLLGIEQHKKETATDTDILKFNQLRSRKKPLKFAKSPIHDWGLYAMEPIPAGDMVIEYVGEIVRSQVADHREKTYEKQGNFSTYLFRVDDDLVVDATHKGNIARLMNHCCVPNCNAKILTLNGQKRIVLYAKFTILPGQELTYDYKFQASGDEEDAIACLCGAEGCRRFL